MLRIWRRWLKPEPLSSKRSEREQIYSSTKCSHSTIFLVFQLCKFLFYHIPKKLVDGVSSIPQVLKDRKVRISKEIEQDGKLSTCEHSGGELSNHD